MSLTFLRVVSLGNMAAMSDDELEVLQAIYCQPGELTVSYGGNGGRQVTVKLQASPTEDKAQPMILKPVEVTLYLSLTSSYPSTPPSVSALSDCLSRADLTHLRSMLVEVADLHLDQPMLMEIISSASEELHKMAAACATNTANGQPDDLEKTQLAAPVMNTGCSESDRHRVALLHLDHMRAKTQYVKLIKKWTSELNLQGRLLFCQCLILILLQGHADSVKEYIMRQRTCNVDVDSKGHPCKERMLSVLCDISTAQQHVRFDDFVETDVKDGDSLQQKFAEYGLKSIFDDHVRKLKHFPGK